MLLENYSACEFECGCDEAGRGCLAGPVVAAAVILPLNFNCPELNDSKQLNEKQRNRIRKQIETQAIAWAVARVENTEIDEINILNASILAMQKAIALLKIKPEFIIVDGNRFKSYEDIPHQTIVKGDSKYMSIAAASVLAKTHRDVIMDDLSLQYPDYDWHINKAYPTKKHRAAIATCGISPLHRRSFRLLETDPKSPMKKKSKRITNGDVKSKIVGIQLEAPLFGGQTGRIK